MPGFFKLASLLQLHGIVVVHLDIVRVGHGPRSEQVQVCGPVLHRWNEDTRCHMT